MKSYIISESNFLFANYRIMLSKLDRYRSFTDRLPQVDDSGIEYVETDAPIDVNWVFNEVRNGKVPISYFSVDNKAVIYVIQDVPYGSKPRIDTDYFRRHITSLVL